ncbi:MAG: DNA-directed RNA polymerase subunit H [Methanosarcinaceae archaeon]|nr:DNA-directed RNA polymerase subunit H [Methanosarcinaceae archaeon]MDF1533592.1 DNA-directed RNA polymerase subunit H [Methanosarcinaceae archaeon]
MRKISLLDHNSVPKHEIIQVDDIKSLLEKYQIEKGQLPKLKESDPVAKELEAAVGDIVKITRISQTADESLYYRLVIE